VKIGIVAESFLPQMNGVVRMLLELLTYLRRQGHEALIFAPGDGPVEAEGYRVRRVKGVPFPPYPEVTLAPFSLWMYRDLRDWQPDIIHLASPFLLGMQGVLVGRLLNVPVVGHFQTDVPRYAHKYHLGALSELAKSYLVTLHNQCALTYCPTPTAAAMLRGWGVERIEVMGRGVDTALFRPDRRKAATRRRYGLSETDKILLYVGRVSAEKNLDVLIETAAALPSARLLIVGDGPERAALEAAMPDTATFTGFLSGDALADVYAAADLFIFPSLTETFGQVAQEAMASGLPVVGMRAGGVQDIIQHGVTGLLCPPDDPAAWLAAVRALLESTYTRQMMGMAARRYAEGQSWTALFDRLLDRYTEIVGGVTHDVAATRH
jgi:glycosyltransferase involved in cell wall biosynthesis